MTITHPHTEQPGDALAAARSLDQRLVVARRTQRGAEHQLAVLLAEMGLGGFRALGYASIHQYATVVLELPPRTARDLLRIGRALSGLPVLDRALASGQLDWTKAREIVRVAAADTEAGWVDRAQAVSARVLEHEVACADRGDAAPAGPAAPEREPIRRRVTFEMETSDVDVLRQALALLRNQSDLGPDEIEDGALLAAMARKILQLEVEDPTHVGQIESASGGEPYRIVLQNCPRCGVMDAPDGDVSDTIAAEACCDAEIIDMRPGPTQGHATRAIPPALRRRVFHRAGWKCEVPKCGNKLWLDVHHTDPWATSHAHAFEKLMVTCDAHHRAIHEGGLAVEIGADERVAVEHADGRRYTGDDHRRRRKNRG